MAVTPIGIRNIPELLDRMWPAWKDIEQSVLDIGLPLTLESIVQLECRKKAQGITFPKYIHHKTAASIAGLHSKSSAAKTVIDENLKHTILTKDQVLRIAANKGLVLHGQQDLICDNIMDVLGEVCVPERSFLEGLSVAGRMPQAIFTIENRGGYVDFPVKRDDLLLIHCPGNDTPLAIRFLSLLPATIPVFHFGDLDSKGVEISSRLQRSVRQKVHHFIPSFWQDYADEETVGAKKWETTREDVIRKNPILAFLRDSGRWLEQERIMCDIRLVDAIQLAISKSDEA